MMNLENAMIRIEMRKTRMEECAISLEECRKLMEECGMRLAECMVRLEERNKHIEPYAPVEHDTRHTKLDTWTNMLDSRRTLLVYSCFTRVFLLVALML